MSNQLKAAALSKLFLCYPSERTRDTDQVKMMIATYLETLSSFSVETLSAACDALRRNPSPFPPAAGEIYDKCADIASRQAQSRPRRIDYQRQELTPEQRQANIEWMKDVLSGRIELPDTPRQKHHGVTYRTVPPSFLEKWEREKGYEHIGRVQILNSRKGAQ